MTKRTGGFTPHNKNGAGFTLLEVLVSATIIAVLTAIGIVSYSSVNKRSRDVKRKSDLEQIRSALEMYRSDNASVYPSSGAGAWTDAANLQASLVSTYMPAIPADPDSTKHYYYRAVSTAGAYSSYCVCSDLETITSGSQSTCTVSLTGTPCDYALKNP